MIRLPTVKEVVRAVKADPAAEYAEAINPIMNRIRLPPVTPAKLGNSFPNPRDQTIQGPSRNARIPSCYSQACHCHPPTGYPRS